MTQRGRNNTLSERIHRFLVSLAFHACPRSPAKGYGEVEARATLYPNVGRTVMGAPVKPPATRGTSGRMTEERTLDGSGSY